ncbi:MAG: tRNA (adenosine(37)-N6)-threonylcarbamoyltransferase complex dimerization subunit type 1 TsaB [Kangiellaceae bacterium]|nr:tRNA (adenosine(37)-N6)-threonylcarbamoyltransferase complex dimerization subunit type 1 TsaB [Kangiellaceae bacterium]
MTKILSIDASTEAVSAALLNGSEVTERYKIAPREHAKLLLPSIQELLAESQVSLNQLDAIACNLGPGAFTGIRIGVSVAQGLAYGADLPAIGLSTLENMALVGAVEIGSCSGESWLCAIDARMNEVYFAAFSVASNEELNCDYEPCVVAPDKIDWQSLEHKLNLGNANLIGTGWQAYQNELVPENSPIDIKKLCQSQFPRASCGLYQAKRKFLNKEFGRAEQLQPIYLRNKVADKKKD